MHKNSQKSVPFGFGFLYMKFVILTEILPIVVMKKEKIDVPAGIRYVSEWNGFSLPTIPCIINKQLTGCGFTRFCITSPDDVVLCSPRKVLLRNKEHQHPGVLYVKNDLEKSTPIDKDLLNESRPEIDEKPEDEGTKEKLTALKTQIQQYVLQQRSYNLPVKILVTYDSFRLVKEALGDSIKNYYVIIDEFQSIFIDSKFKSNTELEFLSFLQNLQKVCFVSATPMMDKYLDMLPEFKDLPYYELDWKEKDPGRITTPELKIIPCRNVIAEAINIIETYKEGRFEKCSYYDEQGNLFEIESRECVIYVNSVKNICDIVKKTGITFDQTNIICARTPENEKKIRGLFKLPKDQSGIGDPPLEGWAHKMFTLCTRTAYLGADFYSTNARTFIFSDANIDCLSVDISLDLPQILGRQRLTSNPWKNVATLYYRTVGKQFKTREEFNQYIKDKLKRTNDLLISYNSCPDENKHTVAETYKKLAQAFNYKDDYIAVNKHAGRDLVPTLNNLVMVSEIRCFEIQQVDYKDRCSVWNSVSSLNYNTSRDKIDELVNQFYALTTFIDRMRFLCDLVLSDAEFSKFEIRIPIEYKNYFKVLGKNRIKALSYQRSKLEAEYCKIKLNNTSDTLETRIYSEFKEGQKYLLSEIKKKLGEIYDKSGYRVTPKATDIERYFKVDNCRIVVDGKKSHGYLICKRK